MTPQRHFANRERRRLSPWRRDKSILGRMHGCAADHVQAIESGLFVAADLARLAQVGISTFLVRESLMREADVAAATHPLLAGDMTMRIAVGRQN